MTSIGDYVFWDCRNLKGITCNAATPPTISSASTFYNVDRSIPIYVPAGSVEDYRNAKYWSEFTNIQTFLASGTCGDNLTWRLTEEYELVIEGTGEMYDYEYENQPWYEYSESIQTISLSASVTSIGNYAFYNCTSLTNIVIPEGVTSIGEDVFFGCSSLTAINIAEGNANYDSREGCNAIIETSSNTLIAGCASTIIPESVTSIGDGAFRNCSSLTAITIPESVTSIGKLAFAWCNSLTAITVAERNTVYDSRGGCNAIIETSSNILIAGCSTTVIPEGIESIGYGAFNGHGLTAITIPEGVTSIGEGAFAYCSSLTSITIPESVTSIENKAFAGCNSLTAVHISSIGAWCNINFVYSESNPLYYAKNLFLNGEPVRELIIPADVTSIGSQPFAYCSSLTSITIPESVTSIEGIAFYDCSSLTAITCKATTPPTIGNSYTFYNVDKSIPVYVPAGSVEAYKSAQYWSEFTNILPLAEVKEFTLSVSAADYATLYLDYNAKIPVGVEIYYAASVEGDRLKMTQITDVLPAGTGVIVRATKGTYTFTEIEGKYDAIEGNLLVGTTTKTLITTLSGYAYYVLANVDGVAMYKPQLTKGCFYNNANKAYLVLKMDDNLGIFDDEVNTDDEGTQLSNRLRFDFGGTTGIEQTTDNSQQTTVIYDLQGRKVTDTEGLKGIYIIDGRKVIIK